MNGLPRVKIINPGGGWLGTECYINDQKIEHVGAIDFSVSVCELPKFIFETMGMPEIDMPGYIQFSFTPQTVTEAVKVLQNELMKHGELYDGFRESIESAIKELPEETEIWSDDLAKVIMKRIIGED